MRKFIYIPNTYNENLIRNRKINENDFIAYQIKYRESFEILLKQMINFSKYDQYIYSLGINIPIVEDHDYNFYHKFSTLGSNYIYLRNNFHIENLSDEEINVIFNCINNHSMLDSDFLNKTYPKVLFEQGNQAVFGLTNFDNILNSKSIIFEFAYDQAKCTDVEQYKNISDAINSVIGSLKKEMASKTKIPISTLVYKAVPDIYYQTPPSKVANFK